MKDKKPRGKLSQEKLSGPTPARRADWILQELDLTQDKFLEPMVTQNGKPLDRKAWGRWREGGVKTAQHQDQFIKRLCALGFNDSAARWLVENLIPRPGGPTDKDFLARLKTGRNPPHPPGWGYRTVLEENKTTLHLPLREDMVGPQVTSVSVTGPLKSIGIGPPEGMDPSVLDIVMQRVHEQMEQNRRHLEALQTGGDTFCYWMLYHFDLQSKQAYQFVVIKQGEYPLYDLRLRITDVERGKDILSKHWGELNAPADCISVKWPLPDSVYYRIFFHARNGSWHQDLQLRLSGEADCWLAATRVLDKQGNVRFEHLDHEFIPKFGPPSWLS